MKINGLSSSTRSADKSVIDSNINRVEKTSLTEQQEKQLSIQKERDNEKELTKEEAEHVIKGMNEFLKPQITSLSFKMHEDLDRYYVEVVDQDTKQVIREIPSKELLDMYAKMTEFLGLFIDEKL